MHRRRVGVIVSGSLVGGLEMKLDEWYSVEDIRAGKFVVIEGEKSRFFCMVTDVRLDTTNPQVLADPPDEAEDLMRQVLHGTTTYGTVCLRPSHRRHLVHWATSTATAASDGAWEIGSLLKRSPAGGS